MLKKICRVCKKEFFVANNRPKARYCSVKCKTKEIPPPNRFKPNSENYSTLHKWIRKKYGNASKCEEKNCDRKSKRYYYALIKGKKYSRNRNDYIQLCASCHKKYDMTPEIREQIIKNLKRK